MTFRQGAIFVVRSLIRPSPGGAPEPLGRVPQIVVDHVPVQVHRHGSGGVPQYSLDHFRISARRQPHRSRRVAQIMNAQLGPPIVTFASRQLIDRCQFVFRSGPPAGAAKSHSSGLLPALPPIHDGHHHRHQRDSPSPLVLQRVDVQLAAPVAC